MVPATPVVIESVTLKGEYSMAALEAAVEEAKKQETKIQVLHLICLQFRLQNPFLRSRHRATWFREGQNPLDM